MGLLGGLVDSLSGAGETRQAAGQVQFDPRDVQGLLGSTTFDEQGNATVTGSGQLQQAMGGLFGSGGQFLQQGTQAATQDFDVLRDESLATLRELAQPQEEQAAASTASRLFNQGVLGSTGGALQMQALEEAQQQADLERQMQAINLAQQQQQQGMQQAQLGAGLFGNAVNIGQAPMQTAQLGATLGGQELQASSQRAGLQAQAGQQRGNFLSGLIGSGGQVAAAGLM